jgi:hypothetical protein
VLNPRSRNGGLVPGLSLSPLGSVLRLPAVTRMRLD